MDKLNGTHEGPALTGIRYPHVGGKRSTSQFHYIATPMVAGGEVVPEQIAEKKDLIAMGKTNEYSIWMKDSKMMETMFKK